MFRKILKAGPPGEMRMENGQKLNQKGEPLRLYRGGHEKALKD